MLELKQQMETEKINLKRYPYTYVRTVVMRSLLFKKDDYHKMLKMGFSEIAKFMQESTYRKEINELSSQYFGADLLEIALNRNLAESFKKLIRISSSELALLVKEYAKRKDIEDLKTILRGKFTNSDEKLTARSITGAGTLSRDFLLSLLKKESVEEVLKSSKLVDFSLLKNALKDFNEKKNLSAVENALDRYYYSHIIQFSNLLPKEGALFRNFLLKEIEILNILTLLRLKKAKFSREIVKNFIIPTGDKIKDEKMLSLIETEDLGQVSKSLEKTEYGELIAKGIEEFKKSNSLISLESGLYKHLLRQSILFMHQHPLSVDVILGYMFAKDIEVRNLRIIIKGKQLGLSEQFIESQLIFE